MEEWLIGRERPETVVAFISGWMASSGKPAIICIDYFDTIVTRTVVPEHTKKIASELLNRLLGGRFSGVELYRLRQQLELTLTNCNAETNGELDFCLHDFGNRFWFFLREHDEGHIAMSRQQFVAALLSIEVAVEKAVQEVCPQVVDVLQRLREQGFPLILVSDFYLPEKHFLDILKALEIDAMFSRIYISSSHGKSKGSGKLYAQIAGDHRCSPDRMLMIGDNLHADIAMARQFGIRTLHLRRPARQDRQELAKETGVHPYFNELPLNGHFSEMGCSLWLFTHRLFSELWQQGARDVFFLSKEGEYLKKLFVLYQTEVFGAELIPSHYLVASRKSTFLPSLRQLDEEDFLRLFAHYRDISISDFLQSLNFQCDVIDTLCCQLAVDCRQRFFDLRNREEFRQLLELPLFREEYENRRTEQRLHFKQYLDSFPVDRSDGRLYLVDVGWKGSIQDNIYHMFEQKLEVNGYFIGSFNATERSGKNRKKGLLFDNYQQLSPFYHVYNNNRSLFEMVLGATHGSADRYVRTQQFCQKTAHAGLEIFSRINTDSGELCVVVLDLPEERVLFKAAIQPLQDNMTRLFSYISKGYLRSGCSVPDAGWFARCHARMVFTPKKEEVDFFAGLYHLENFGIFEYTNFQADPRLSLRERYRNLRSLLRDPSILESGIWPPVILRRLGLGFLQGLDGRRRLHRNFSQ